MSRSAVTRRAFLYGSLLIFTVPLAANRLPALAAGLVRAGVDVIVAVSIRTARQATTSIPIVMAYWGGPDLVQSGVALPGGNITRVHMLNTALDPKQLELLVQAVPAAAKVAVLVQVIE